MSYRSYEAPGRFLVPPDSAVTFDGKSYSARKGEPLAVTLHAHGVRVLGRSGKYHRPRGLSCGRGACGTCVARINGLPNQRTCTHIVAGQEESRAQNVLGTARFDLLSPIDWVFRGGLDHHHLMTESVTLNRVAVTMARKIAGLGRLPEPREEKTIPPFREASFDVVVVGGGEAGRAVAEVTRARGLSTLVVDALSSGAGVERATVLGFYDDRELLAVRGLEQMRLRARAIVLANGAYEQTPACVGNDLPGVLMLRAAELLLSHGVLPGKRVIVAVTEDASQGLQERARELLRELVGAGVQLVATVGPVTHRAASHAVTGGVVAIEEHDNALRVRAPDLAQGFDGDALIYIAPPVPAYELPRQMGVATRFDATLRAFVPVAEEDGTTTRSHLFLAGEVCGLPSERAASHGAYVGDTVVRALARVS